MDKKEAPRRLHFQQHTLEETEKPPFVSWRGAFLLGIAMKLGGCTIAWNYGLAVGFWEYFIAVMVIGLGYLCLGLCMSEMISIISFSGGYYGYARCAIGPFFGYIVGCCGLMESTFGVAMNILKIGQFVTMETGFTRNYEPIWWLCTFAFTLSFHVIGAKYFYELIGFIAIVCLLFVLIFLFGSLPVLDYSLAVNDKHPAFSTNFIDFFSVFRLSVLFFLGFDMLTLTSADVKDSKQAVPKAMLSLISTLFVLAIWLLFSVACQAPGVTKQLYQLPTLFPLIFGYERIFGISRLSATCIAIIPSFSTVLAYMYVVGKQVNSMAKSGLLPAIFKITVTEERVPLLGMIFVCCFATTGLFYSWWANPYTTLSRFSTLSGCIIYVSMFVCYIIFNTRYSNMERSFRNPLGIASAIFGILIFTSVFIIIISFNLEYYQVTVLFAGYLLIVTIYYYMYAETHQFFSASEQKVFFKAYIVNMQRRKKQSMHKRMLTDIIKVIDVFGVMKWSQRSKVYCASSSLENSDSRHNSGEKVSKLSAGGTSSMYLNHNITNHATLASEKSYLNQVVGGGGTATTSRKLVGGLSSNALDCVDETEDGIDGGHHLQHDEDQYEHEHDPEQQQEQQGGESQSQYNNKNQSTTPLASITFHDQSSTPIEEEREGRGDLEAQLAIPMK